MNPSTDQALHTLRAIAAFETFKGILALLLLWLVLTLTHLDLHAWALSHIVGLGLDPVSRYPAMVLDYADALPHTDLRIVTWLALGYAALRFVEAFGLWQNMNWAKYLGAGSGGIYIPFEVEHWLNDPNALSMLILGTNICIVGYLIYHLWQERAP